MDVDIHINNLESKGYTVIKSLMDISILEVLLAHVKTGTLNTGDPEHHHSEVFVMGGELADLRKRRDARAAPRGPKIEDDDFPLERGENIATRLGDGFERGIASAPVTHSECGGCLADHRAVRLACTAQTPEPLLGKLGF